MIAGGGVVRAEGKGHGFHIFNTSRTISSPEREIYQPCFPCRRSDEFAGEKLTLSGEFILRVKSFESSRGLLLCTLTRLAVLRVFVTGL